MGAWLPSALKRTSNWKELNTLLLTLQQLIRDPKLAAVVAGTTVFYFTDNVVTYYISHSGSTGIKPLHRLIMKIKDLERLLQVRLEVVHVPGDIMIDQGTDGLSRGLWMAETSFDRPGRAFTKSVFDPVLAHHELPLWVQQQCGAPELPVLQDWTTKWAASTVLHTFGLWLPPPTLAQQLLYFLLELWIETPLSTSFALLVPRVMQREWQFLSRYVQRVGEYKLEMVPCGRSTDTLPIPLVLLYVSTHTRSLKPNRPKKSAIPASQKRHRQQADEMRGM
jgi:hypothetical protein